MIRVQRTLPARLLLAGVSAATLTTGMPVTAQEASGDEEAFAIDTIVVTARRRDESIVEVPIAVSTFDADKLDMRGALDITALQRNSPNLTLQVSRGTNSTLTAFIRGIGQQDPLWGFEPGVGLYVDDVYIARPQGAILDIFDIERIEVLRGPQGTLYGRNTIGGAIKYITKRLGQEPTFKVRTNLGNYEQRDLVASGSVPLGDKAAIGAAIGWYNRDGYGTNHFTGRDTNNKKSFAARLTLEATPSEDLFFRLSADRTEDDSNTNHGHREAPVPADWAVLPLILPGYSPDAGTVPAGAFPVQANKYDTWAGLGDDNEVITEGVSLLAEWLVSDSLTVKSITAYRQGVTNGTGIDFDGTPAAILDIAATGSVYDDHQFSQELQLVLDRDGWSGIVGAYYLDALATGKYDTILGIGAYGLPVPTPHFTQGTTGEVDTRSIALFGDFDVDLGERFNLSLGGRWTRDKKDALVFKANYLGLGSPVSGNDAALLIQTLSDYTNELTFEEFTPRVSLSYSLADDMNVYAAYSRGFKSGGFDMRGDATATPATMDGYEPETVDSFEIGLKGNVLDGRLAFAGAIFHTAYDGQQITSQQVNAAGTGVVSFVDNVGSSTINGAELEATAWFTPAFSMDFAVGYVDAKFDEYLAYAPAPGGGYEQVDVADARQFQNTPEWNGNVALNYVVDLDTRGTLALRGAMSFRSSVNMFEIPLAAIDQPAYELFDASIVWTSADETWRVGLHGRNLANERYRTGAYNFPGLAYGDSVIGFYGPPRSIFASIEYRY